MKLFAVIIIRIEVPSKAPDVKYMRWSKFSASPDGNNPPFLSMTKYLEDNYKYPEGTTYSLVDIAYMSQEDFDKFDEL